MITEVLYLTHSQVRRPRKPPARHTIGHRGGLPGCDHREARSRLRGPAKQCAAGAPLPLGEGICCGVIGALAPEGSSNSCRSEPRLPRGQNVRACKLEFTLVHKCRKLLPSDVFPLPLGNIPRPLPPSTAVVSAASLLRGADRPLIVAGKGAAMSPGAADEVWMRAWMKVFQF